MIGDVEAAKSKSSRGTPTQVVVRFALYAAMANVVILIRSQPGVYFSVNDSIKSTLEMAQWKRDPQPAYFKDVRQMGDVAEWIDRALLNKVKVYSEYGYPLSLLSFNRVVPSTSVCTESGSIELTARFIKVTKDSSQTTTKKFEGLYPETWLADSIPPGAKKSDSELTADVQKPRPYNGHADKDIPTELFGEDRFGQPIDAEVMIDLLRVGDPIYSGWAYSKDGGYKNAGGYQAVITLGKVVDGDITCPGHELPCPQYVFLLDSKKPAKAYPELGICGEISASGAMTVDDFVRSSFMASNGSSFNRFMTSLVVEFTLYNANFQSMSQVTIEFTALASGIISQKKISVDTFMLDMFTYSTPNDWLNYTEVCYLVATWFYFADLAYRSWRNASTALRDVWNYINLLSIVCSFLTFIISFLLKSEVRNFMKDQSFTDRERLFQLMDMQGQYLMYSAFAVLTIWLRLLQFLAKSKARVRLLMQTLAMTVSDMAIYFSYILVIFWGFAAFAMTTFGSVSLAFTDPVTALLTCADMFLGKTEEVDKVSYAEVPTKALFYFPFMVFFFFICVQMFNAIINYAYNRVSEAMNPQFERERAERKRKELQSRLDMKPSMYRRAYTMFVASCPGLRSMLAADNKDKEKDAEMQSTLEAGKASRAQADAAALENVSDEGAQEKVEAFMTKEKQRKAPDVICSKLVFSIFAVSYILFLWFNIEVNSSAKIQHAMKRSMFEATVVIPELDGKGDRLLMLEEVRNAEDLAIWFGLAFPQGIYGNSRETIVPKGIRNEGTACTKGWNCFISGPENDGNQRKLARVTLRRSKVFNNTGTIAGERLPTTKNNQIFTGGFEDNIARSSVLAPKRRTLDVIGPETPPGSSQDQSSELAGEVSSFCKREDTGKGFLNFGGIVCMLDADEDNFTKQVYAMMISDLFTMQTAAVSIEYVAYNGNANMIMHTGLLFTVSPAGSIEWSMDIRSMLLIDFSDWKQDPGHFAKRMLPMVVYCCSVFYFIWHLFRDLRSELFRKKLNEDKSYFQTTIDFFFLDIFNSLEVCSVAISLIGLGMYLAFLVEQHTLDQKIAGPQSDLISMCQSLASQGKMYNRLSAINLLIIFVRPLKFFREDPRMSKLFQTLFDARVDIFWFVIMLFLMLMAFVMFAHVSFGMKVKELSRILASVTYCFYYILGTFDFQVLHETNAFLAYVFYYPYLLTFYCIFTNIFFAIIDRNFVSAEPPPFNLRRKFKPLFGRLCRCIEWDEDYVMEDDPNEKKKQGPPTRKHRVHETSMEIERISSQAGDNVKSATGNKAYTINEVCEMDDRMSDVVSWSKEEARAFVDQFQRLLVKKHNPKNMKQEDVFINKEVMVQNENNYNKEKKEMEEAHRHQRYAIQVHEQMCMRDQGTLAHYILLLEGKIKRRMHQKKALLMEVHHLRAESTQMRYTVEETKNGANFQLFDKVEDSNAAPINDGYANDGGEGELEGDAASSSEEEVDPLKEKAAMMYAKSKGLAVDREGEPNTNRRRAGNQLADQLKQHLE